MSNHMQPENKPAQAKARDRAIPVEQATLLDLLEDIADRSWSGRDSEEEINEVLRRFEALKK